MNREREKGIIRDTASAERSFYRPGAEGGFCLSELAGAGVCVQQPQPVVRAAEVRCGVM